MDETNPELTVSPPSRYLPVLLLLMAASGCAALIYEIVWFQLLQLVIGSSAVSLAVLLGTFMGGMCLGSAAFARIFSAGRHPLRVYAALEMGIGILGIVVWLVMPLVARLYLAGATQGFSGLMLRGLVCAACLLPPTLLMGATLPAMARWIEATPQGVSRLGFLYGGNTAGAVIGCLLAGFYLLRVHDIAMATAVAALLNGVVALAAFSLTVITRHHSPALESAIRNAQSATAQCPSPTASKSWAVYVTIALSGACALGAEVIWTRLLSLLLGGTVYTFSIILAVFLAGLGVGSGIGSMLTRGTIRPRVALAVCQLLLTAAIAWAAYSRALPSVVLNSVT